MHDASLNFSASQEKLPFAEKMRPRCFEDVLGQDKIWAPRAPLRRLVEEDRFYSLIFWGPPGTGKTSIAKLIGSHLQRRLDLLSAVHCGVKDIRKCIDSSLEAKNLGGKSSVLFLDEIHRLSKNQQDVLLPSLESGDIKLIGATTENPSFTVNNAVLSRSLVFRFELIAPDVMIALMKRSLEKERKDLLEKIPQKVWQSLAEHSGGDARRALNVLEALSVLCEKEGSWRENEEAFYKILEDLSVSFDRKGDHHYDTISALIKCIRASQTDAALYYLAKAIVGGEDVEFLARRLVILAAEDVGLANPHALVWAQSTSTALKEIGMPEGRILLAELVCLLATSPKSNRSYKALEEALSDAKAHPHLEVPFFLRNAPTQLMKDSGYSKGYIYAHDNPEGAKHLNYLPKGLEKKSYYIPSQQGFEKNLKMAPSKEQREH